MIPVLASVFLAVTIDLPAVQTTKVAESSSTHPVLLDLPTRSNGLTFNNARGEVVARCAKKTDYYNDCKMESGVTFDDLMAWAHAYPKYKSKILPSRHKPIGGLRFLRCEVRLENRGFRPAIPGFKAVKTKGSSSIGRSTTAESFRKS